MAKLLCAISASSVKDGIINTSQPKPVLLNQKHFNKMYQACFQNAYSENNNYIYLHGYVM